MDLLRNAFIVLYISAFLSACGLLPNNVKGDKPVARVHDSYLYESELSGIVQTGTSKKDSGLLVRNYIDNWARQQLLLSKASLNLSLDEIQGKLDKQIEDYRVSLIIHAYKKELIRQQLDTIITDDQIKEYYDLHKDKLRLGESVANVNYIKLSNDIKGLKKLKKLLASKDEDDKEELIDFCQKHAFEFLLEEDAWMSLDQLFLLIPVKPVDQKKIQDYRGAFEIHDSVYTYIVHLNEFRLSGEVSPLPLEIRGISNVILNVRKRELLKNLEGNILKDAISMGEFEVFEQQ